MDEVWGFLGAWEGCRMGDEALLWHYNLSKRGMNVGKGMGGEQRQEEGWGLV